MGDQGPKRSAEEGKMFVGGLKVSTEKMRDYFATYGEIVDAYTVTMKGSNVSRGFGYVVFKEKLSMDAAMNAGPHVIDGNTVEVNLPSVHRRPPKEDLSTRRVFLGGVGKGRDHLTKDQLRDYFSQYGKLRDVEVVMDKNKEAKGYGFVEYESEEDFKKCVANDLQEVCGRRLEVKPSSNTNVKEKGARTPCIFFHSGQCNKGPECPFIHDPRDADSPALADAMTCKFFDSDKGCQAGSACKFLHERPRRSMDRGPPPRDRGWDRGGDRWGGGPRDRGWGPSGDRWRDDRGPRGGDRWGPYDDRRGDRDRGDRGDRGGWRGDRGWDGPPRGWRGPPDDWRVDGPRGRDDWGGPGPWNGGGSEPRGPPPGHPPPPGPPGGPGPRSGPPRGPPDGVRVGDRGPDRGGWRGPSPAPSASESFGGVRPDDRSGGWGQGPTHHPNTGAPAPAGPGGDFYSQYNQPSAQLQQQQQPQQPQQQQQQQQAAYGQAGGRDAASTSSAYHQNGYTWDDKTQSWQWDPQGTLLQGGATAAANPVATNWGNQPAQGAWDQQGVQPGANYQANANYGPAKGAPSSAQGQGRYNPW